MITDMLGVTVEFNALHNSCDPKIQGVVRCVYILDGSLYFLVTTDNGELYQRNMSNCRVVVELDT